MDSIPLYIFSCAQDKYFIHRSTDSLIELVDRYNKGEYEWISRYPVEKLVEWHDSASLGLVHAKTIAYMAKYGIDNVRRDDLPPELPGKLYSTMLLEVGVKLNDSNLMNRAINMIKVHTN
jgi:hypothetical protein